MAKWTLVFSADLGGPAPPTALGWSTHRLSNHAPTPSSRQRNSRLSQSLRPPTIFSSPCAPKRSLLILRSPVSRISFHLHYRYFSTLRGRLVPEIVVHFANFGMLRVSLLSSMNTSVSLKLRPSRQLLSVFFVAFNSIVFCLSHCTWVSVEVHWCMGNCV